MFISCIKHSYLQPKSIGATCRFCYGMSIGGHNNNSQHAVLAEMPLTRGGVTCSPDVDLMTIMWWVDRTL